jgi:hypothetical protein
METPKVKIIGRYIRDNHFNPRAKIVAFKKDGKVHIGWSMCNKKDTFSKKKANEIAVLRALKWVDDPNRSIPKTLEEEMETFIYRAKRYFKDVNKSNYPVWSYNYFDDGIRIWRVV